MMQDGLHIGLAAWINQQQRSGSFPAYPAMPIAISLVDLEAIQDIYDLAIAAEFARLVNFVPRQGQVADTFSDSVRLWQVHRDILGQMDHATAAWTSAEQAEYQAAWDILYITDASGLPAPSQKHLLYIEMRNGYRDVNNSYDSPDETAQAMTNWIVLGHKHDIEDAFEVISRLADRSSRNQADKEGLLLSEDPPGVGFRYFGNMQFAPVYFAPISAIARETWMEAKVSFADLDHAVGSSPPNNKWKAFLANRVGEVLFDYVAINCMRPWFTPALYQADDWKLVTDDTMVSKGNGTEGLLPAYVDAVYLVDVKNITTNPVPPRSRPDPGPIPYLSSTTDVVRAELSQPILQPKSLGKAGPSKGVVKKAVNTPMSLRLHSTSSGSLLPRHLSKVQTPTVTNSRFVKMNLGQVRKLTAIDLHQRYIVAQSYLEGLSWTSPVPPEETISSEIYVAGFGCKKIPFAPNPNINYQW